MLKAGSTGAAYGPPHAPTPDEAGVPGAFQAANPVGVTPLT